MFVCQASTVIELSSVSGVTLDSDERYTVSLLRVDGGAVLGTVWTRSLLLLASASPSGVMQLYFAGSRYASSFSFVTGLSYYYYYYYYNYFYCYCYYHQLW